jgi:hypothetical protein
MGDAGGTAGTQAFDFRVSFQAFNPCGASSPAKTDGLAGVNIVHMATSHGVTGFIKTAPYSAKSKLASVHSSVQAMTGRMHLRM